MTSSGGCLQLGPGDYKAIVPEALAGFEMLPNCARIVGERLSDGGYKFTYTLEWFHLPPVKTKSKKRKRSGKNKKKLGKRGLVPEDDSESQVCGKKGIIDPLDDVSATPAVLAVREIDGALYHVVENEGCVLRLEGNAQFNDLMRLEAMEQGLYHPSCYTPKVEVPGHKMPSKTAVVIRKMYFDEWMRFRERGENYDGLWKGIIYRQPIRPKVDFKNDPDWLMRYPNLWPSCQIIRNGQPVVTECSSDTEDDWSEVHTDSASDRSYRRRKAVYKEKRAARKKWVQERQRHAEEDKRKEGENTGERKHLQTQNPVYLRLSIPDSRRPGGTMKRELMQPAGPEQSVDLLVLAMLQQSGLQHLLPDWQVIQQRVYFKTQSGRRRRLKKTQETRLADLPKVEGDGWRLYVGLTPN